VKRKCHVGVLSTICLCGHEVKLGWEHWDRNWETKKHGHRYLTRIWHDTNTRIRNFSEKEDMTRTVDTECLENIYFITYMFIICFLSLSLRGSCLDESNSKLFIVCAVYNYQYHNLISSCCPYVMHSFECPKSVAECRCPTRVGHRYVKLQRVSMLLSWEMARGWR